MFEILLAIGLLGIIGFCLFLYLKWREKAKQEGYISDDYIENNDQGEGKVTLIVRSKNEKLIEEVKKLDGIEEIKQYADDELVIKKKIPVYTLDQLVEKVKEEEKENGKDN